MRISIKAKIIFLHLLFFKLILFLKILRFNQVFYLIQNSHRSYYFSGISPKKNLNTNQLFLKLKYQDIWKIISNNPISSLKAMKSRLVITPEAILKNFQKIL